jgi:hypothetical protein
MAWWFLKRQRPARGLFRPGMAIPWAKLQNSRQPVLFRGDLLGMAVFRKNGVN